MASGALAKRAAPEEVPAVTADTIVYSVPHFTTDEKGRSVQGGVVAARDLKSGRLLWSLRVYQTTRDDRLEGDVQDVFIKTLAHDKVHELLVLADETGRVFVIDLKSRKPVRIR